MKRFSRTLPRTLLMVAVCCVVAGLGRAEAQEIGDQVVPKAETALKVKDEVVGTVDGDDVLTVEQVQDKWLWVVSADGTKGWVKSDAVQPYEESAPATPDGAAPPTPEPPLDPEKDRLFLIGMLGGTHVYTTYLYIGVVADGLSKDLYTDEQTKELLNEVVASSDTLMRNLTRVRDGGLSEEDAAAINEMIEIHGLLQEQANAAIIYTDSRSEEDAQRFDQIRTTVWPKIASLLGLETAS
jgi:hypothetical protein